METRAEVIMFPFCRPGGNEPVYVRGLFLGVARCPRALPHISIVLSAVAPQPSVLDFLVASCCCLTGETTPSLRASGMVFAKTKTTRLSATTTTATAVAAHVKPENPAMTTPEADGPAVPLLLVLTLRRRAWMTIQSRPKWSNSALT